MNFCWNALAPQIRRRKRKHPVGTHETWPYFGLTLEEASHAVRASERTLRRIIREDGYVAWPEQVRETQEKQNTKYKERVNKRHLSLYVIDEEGIELEETENVQQDSQTNPFLAGELEYAVILGPSDLRKETKNQLLSQVEFMAEIPESFDVFALVVVESNQEDFHVPSQVISILEESADVGPQELPSGLPPMRDIQHCMGFWCRVLPNPTS
ncbi:hypothetical protein Tco_0857600 [Tanacetum coccineum]|uniref:RWP-RK domain-containing protein n=1 Tax=Tanacetum coccineum TaxID=301880 RepID=A0ABQ5B9S7_9ASTR